MPLLTQLLQRPPALLPCLHNSSRAEFNQNTYKAIAWVNTRAVHAKPTPIARQRASLTMMQVAEGEQSTTCEHALEPYYGCLRRFRRCRSSNQRLRYQHRKQCSDC